MRSILRRLFEEETLWQERLENISNGSIGSDSELGQWIAWAGHKANWIDPLVNAKCPVLDEE